MNIPNHFYKKYFINNLIFKNMRRFRETSNVKSQNVCFTPVSNNMPIESDFSQMSFGDEEYQLVPGVCRVIVEDLTGKHRREDEISLILYKERREVNINKQPVVVYLSKEKAEEFAIRLLKYSSEGVPTMKLDLDCESVEWNVSVQPLKDLEGNSMNQPLIVIEGMEKEDIPGNGCCTIPIERSSAKKLISMLAEIV